MKRLPANVRHAIWIAATLLLAMSPAAAQTATPSVLGQAVNPNGQQLLGTRSARQVPSQAPPTGTFCIEEMTATFCNVPTGPNTNGYGSVDVGRAELRARHMAAARELCLDQVELVADHAFDASLHL